MTPPIAILGGGPAGIMLGRLLHLADIDFVIFERDENKSWTFGRGGSGTLDMHPGSGLLAIQTAQLYDKFKKLARFEVHTKMADMHGNVFLDLVDEGDDDKPEIDRKDLRVLLLDSVPAEKVQWNHKVQTVEKDANGTMSVHFADGSVESGFRLIVGADGAWSHARPLVMPSPCFLMARAYILCS
jgi:2-polyprenyl-6-methoxyphenol hydroxylase-like FAD-dependent oxidoreductase